MEFDDLVEQGVFIFAGVDENDEAIFSIDMDRCREVFPALYWHEMNQIDEAILKAIDLGFITMDIDPDNLEVTYTVTDLGHEYLGD